MKATPTHSLRARLEAGDRPARPLPSMRSIMRRRWMVGFTKRVLPIAAVALLVCLALWPELSREVDRARMAYRLGTISGDGGQLKNVRYNGLDSQGQPYTLTADTAHQIGQDRFDMTNPVGDLTMHSGDWLNVKGRTGVYMQGAAQLDLAGDVTMYRDDGTTMLSDTATVDVHSGVATSADRTHVEGPFGTLDAQGFTMTDHGQVLHFPGPGRLVLNGGRK